MSGCFADMHAQADAYGEAVYFARADVFEDMCHDRFTMTMVDGGKTTFWDKSAYLDRVRARSAAPGAASYKIKQIDVMGDIGRVHLWVDVPPARYEDHLGFIREDGTWKLLTKVFRPIVPDQEG